jgi:hypothetical protein
MNGQAAHEGRDGPARAGDLDEKRLALDWARLRADRQKTAIEFTLRCKELDHTTGRKYFELLANPFVLAIVGGFITLMTSIFTNHFLRRTILKLRGRRLSWPPQQPIRLSRLN